MKLGILSAIFAEKTFEQTIDTIAEAGLCCVELACWPSGQAERRYAGVCHLDVETIDAQKATYVLDYCKSKGVQISALCYYPNTMDPDVNKRSANIAHLKRVIDASAMLDIGLVTTFIGRDQSKNLEENINLFRQTWPSIISYAESRQVRIAIENCPMLFDETQWPGGQNLAYAPNVWDMMFDIIPSLYFGLNYDPSHFVWQMMDYISPIYTYKDRIFHVHFKDIHIQRDKLNSVGILAYPLSYMTPKLPGLGDVNWAQFVSALNDVGYKGFACIEMEDRSYEGSSERVHQGLLLSKRYMENFVI